MERPFYYGIIGGLLLLLVYFGLLTLANSFDHAVSQFFGMWYWITALVIGFGVQIGLYFHVRMKMHAMAASGTGAVAVSGGMSAGSMVLCCLHHVTDILPLIGLSAAALFLSQYQVSFMVLGVLSNLVGITIMLNVMQRHGVRNFRFNMIDVRNVAFVAAVLIFAFVLLSDIYAAPAGIALNPLDPLGGSTSITDITTISLGMKTNDEAGVEIDATPLDFALGKEVVFQIGLNTHQGDLDFDVKDIAVLRDSEGNVYYPISWEGSPPGGHHRSGKLTFPAVKGNWMELTLKNIYGVPERAFRWEV